MIANAPPQARRGEVLQLQPLLSGGWSVGSVRLLMHQISGTTELVRGFLMSVGKFAGICKRNIYDNIDVNYSQITEIKSFMRLNLKDL